MAIFYAKGRYRVRIIDQALGRSSSKGTPQFVLRFLVLGRVVGPEQVEEVTQYERTSYHYITDKTAERLSQELQSVGFTGNSWGQLDLDHDRAHDFRGQEFDMYCGEENDLQGNPREKWGFPKVGGLDVAPLDKKQARELDSLFGKHLKKSPAPAAAPATAGASARPNAAPSMEITDDDVPF